MHRDDVLYMQCLCLLSALQHLELCCASNLCIGPSLSALQRLTHVGLTVESDPRARQHLTLLVDWAAMQALQQVEILAETLLYNEMILNLAKMEHLKLLHVRFTPSGWNFSDAHICWPDGVLKSLYT